jgi:hypothetical protein
VAQPRRASSAWRALESLSNIQELRHFPSGKCRLFADIVKRRVVRTLR